MDDILTVQEVATLTKRHAETITAALRAKTLKGHQRIERGRWLVRRGDAIAWALGEMPDLAA